MDVAAWRAGGAVLDWHGTPIFHRAGGSGEPLLLLHGFPTSSWDWKELWPALIARYRVIAFDYAGFGFSGKRGPYSVFAYAGQAQAVLHHHGVDTVHVLAHDLGDTVAQELLARSPLRLVSVCLLNGGLFPELHRPRPIQRALASPLGPFVSSLVDRKRFERSLRKVFGARTQPSAEQMEGFWQCAEASLPISHRLIGYMRERRRQRHRWVPALLDQRIPLAFIDGLADPVSGVQMVRRLRQLRPTTRITELEGIGHYPQIEAPQAVLDAYLAFRSATEGR